MPLVAVVGSANVDVVVPVRRVPAAGETVLALGPARRHPGGKGLNQAVAAARAGADVAMVGSVGDDEDGRRLRALLEEEGVATNALSTTSRSATGTAHICVQADGDNAIVVVAGANGDATSLGAGADVVAAASVVLGQLEVPAALVAEALALARASGAGTVLNAAPATPDARELLGLVDVLVVNEHEARALAPASAGSVAEAAVRLGGHDRDVVVTLGGDGALVRHRDGAVTHVASRPVRVVDTTGAGDAAVGHLVAGLVAGLPLAEAVERACAAGALAVQAHGAVPSLPTRGAVDRLLAG